MKFNWKSFANILAYVAVVLVGVALLIQALIKGNNEVSGIIKMVADIIAYAILIMCSFTYAKSRRSVVFLIIWVIAVILIVVSYIV